MNRTLLIVAACTLCLDWTRLSGTVKAFNYRDSTVTIQNRDGDLLTVPIDYQVRIVDKGKEPLDLKKLVLDQKVVLLRTVMDKPVDDTAGMAEPHQR